MRSKVFISRLLMTLLVMLPLCGQAQNRSYRAAIKDYITATGLYTAEKMQSHLLSQNANLFENEYGVNLSRLTSQYIKGQYIEDMVDLYEIVFKDNVSEVDLRKVISLLSTPAGISMTKHTLQWSEQFEQDIVGEVQEPLMQAMAGLDITTPLLDDDVSLEYGLSFVEFMQNTNQNEQFMTVYRETLKANGTTVPDEFDEWLEDNLIILALNSAKDYITMSDLEYSAELFTYESYQHVTSAASFFTDNLMLVGSFIIARYADWMTDNGASLSSTGVMMLEYMNNLTNQD